MLFLTTQYYAPKDLIIRKGDINNNMFFIEKGTCIINNSELGTEEELTKGSYFCESAILIKRFSAESTITADSWVELITLSYDNFQNLLDRYPLAKRHIAHWMKQNMSNNAQFRKSLYSEYADSLDELQDGPLISETLNDMKKMMEQLINQNKILSAQMNLLNKEMESIKSHTFDNNVT